MKNISLFFMRVSDVCFKLFNSLSILIAKFLRSSIESWLFSVISRISSAMVFGFFWVDANSVYYITHLKCLNSIKLHVTHKEIWGKIYKWYQCLIFWWPKVESNHRHKDFQSSTYIISNWKNIFTYDTLQLSPKST